MSDFSSKLDSVKKQMQATQGSVGIAEKIRLAKEAKEREESLGLPAPQLPSEDKSETFRDRLSAIKDAASYVGSTSYQSFNTAAAGLYGSSANVFHTLDNWSSFISRKTGLDKSGIFGRIAEDQARISRGFEEKGINPEDGLFHALAYHIYSGFGKATFDLPIIMAAGLPAFSAAMAGGEAAGDESASTGQVIRSTGEGLAHGLILHSVFKHLAPYTKTMQMSSAALVMGGESMVAELQKPFEQRDLSRVIADAFIGAGLAAGGKGKTTLREASDQFYRSNRADIDRAAEILGVETRGLQRAKARAIAEKFNRDKRNFEEVIKEYEEEIKSITGVIQQIESDVPADLAYANKQSIGSRKRLDVEFLKGGEKVITHGDLTKIDMALAFVEARYPNLVKMRTEVVTRQVGKYTTEVVPGGIDFVEFLNAYGKYHGLQTVSKKHLPDGTVKREVKGQVIIRFGRDTVGDYISTITHELTHNATTINWSAEKVDAAAKGKYPNEYKKAKEGSLLGGEYSSTELVARNAGIRAEKRYYNEVFAEIQRLTADARELKINKETQLELLKVEYKIKFAAASAKDQKKTVSMQMEGAAKPPAEDEVTAVRGDISYAKPKGDIWSFSWRWRSMESLLKKFPEARDIAGENIEAQLRAHHNIYTIDEALFREIETNVPKDQRKHLRTAVERLYRLREKDPNTAQKLIDEGGIYQSANRIIGYFENMRDTILQYKREMYHRKVPKDLYDAFIATIALNPDKAMSMDEYIENMARAYGVKYEPLKEYVTEYKAIEKWGLKDFVTNIEVGSWRVIENLSDGTQIVRAVGTTRKEATRKAEQIRDAGEVKGDLVISSEFRKPVDPTQPRKGILRGEEDIMKALRTYSRVIRQKIEFDTAESIMLKKFKEDEGSILYPHNVRKSLIKQLNDARFVHSWGDEVLDSLQQGFSIGGRHFKGFGGRPLTFTRAVQTATGITANAKLGYRLVGGFVNYVSGHGHTWVKSGADYMAKGIEFMRSPEGKRFLIEEEAYLGLDFATSEAGKVHSKTPWYKPLGTFSMPEPGIRRLSVATNYVYALEKLGMDAESARLFARRGVRAQNFTYNTAAIPGILRSPGGKLVGQFKTYLVKEMEFLSTLSGKEWGRYLTLQMMLGGPRAMLATLKSVPFLGLLGVFDKIEEELLKDKTGLSSGVPGVLLGADISAPASFQVVPERPEDNFGPFLSEMVKFWSGYLKPTLEGQPYTLNNAADWARNVAPIARHWDALIQSVLTEDKNGQVWIRDNLKFRGTGARPMITAVGAPKYLVNGNWDRALMVAGAGTTSKAKVQVANRLMAEARKKDNESRKKISRELLDSIQSNTPISQDLVEKLAIFQIDQETIDAAYAIREMTPKERALFYNNTVLKLKALDLYE